MLTKVILWFFALGWAFFLLNMPGGPPILLAFGPIGALAAWEFFRIKRSSGTQAALLGLLEMQDGQGRIHVSGGSGIALNPATKRIALYAGGGGKAYAYDEVRGWETVKQQAGQMFASGVAGGIAAAGHNIGQSMAAAKATGFFVTVRDIDFPKWRAEMPSESDQARWMEILRQEINGD